MLRRFLVPALLCFIPFVVEGCGGQTGSSGGTGGAQNGGTTTAAGGTSTPSGGVAGGAGGTTTATGGTTTASGGSTTASGGTTTAPGGSTTSGGTTAATGGARTGGRTGGGGTTTGSGGATTASGGTTTTSGGTTTASGGARAGGATGRGGATTGAGGTPAGTGGARTGGTTGTGGTTAAGGSTGGLEVWISPNGNDDTGTGTKESPLFSICWDDGDADPEIKKGACYKICPVGVGCNPAGGTIWVMDGTYKYKVTQKIGSKKPATANGMVKVFAEPGAKPVLDFGAMAVDEENRGIQLGADYWHIKGLTVINAGDNGIIAMGSNEIIEQCIAHDNNDTGIQIGVNSDAAGSGRNNLVLNCDSYHNIDEATNGENADGFGAKESEGGTGNIFRGCRAWDNADDGFDFYAWAAPVTVENCWAMSQSKSNAGSKSDGNGFKLGGDDVSATHILKSLFATDNKYASSNCGFTNNNNPASMTCTGNCAAWDNGTNTKNIGGIATTAPGGATAAKMIAAQRNADGSLPDIGSL
ncbi:MAG: right-handed parallel beta-helix repeat-containing protein [Deltaproteobacteria bacterium]|nr:right-handed parallel beta-helix repeat-containing protein [Deltaproteobacteria bacterium]